MRVDMNNAGLAADAESSRLILEYALVDGGEDLDEWVVLSGFLPGIDPVAETNLQTLLNQLDDDPDNIREAGMGHYAVRVLDTHGELTQAGEILDSALSSLSDYPVLDDMGVSKIELEGTLENIKNEGWDLVSDMAPDDWEAQVFNWIWEHNRKALESRTERGDSYVEADDIAEALKALGWLEEDEY